MADDRETLVRHEQTKTAYASAQRVLTTGDARLDKLKFVTGLHAIGFSLEEIRNTVTVKRRTAARSVAPAPLVGLLDAQIDVVSKRLVLLGSRREELLRTRTALSACTEYAEIEPLSETREKCQVKREVKELPSALNPHWEAKR